MEAGKYKKKMQHHDKSCLCWCILAIQYPGWI